jgi:hypothetical protein
MTGNALHQISDLLLLGSEADPGRPPPEKRTLSTSLPPKRAPALKSSRIGPIPLD